jgi:hypothetical protein
MPFELYRQEDSLIMALNPLPMRIVVRGHRLDVVESPLVARDHECDICRSTFKEAPTLISSSSILCSKEIEFWGKILRGMRNITSRGKRGVSIDFSIPPAFGSQARCLSCGLYKNKCDTVEGDIVERYNRDWRREVYHQVDDCYGSSRPDLHYRKEELDAFLEHQRLFGSGRVLFRTGNSLGLGPLRLRERDSVWLLDSSKVAIILRKVDSHYLVIGECHLHGALRQYHPCPRCRKVIQLADTITTETIEIW